MLTSWAPSAVSFMTQPSENANSRKSKREKEKHLQCYYGGRLGGSLTTEQHLCRPSPEPTVSHGSTSRSRFSQMCWFLLPPVELPEG